MTELGANGACVICNQALTGDRCTNRSCPESIIVSENRAVQDLERQRAKEAEDPTVRPPDMVNSPPHYGGQGNPYEHYKVCKAWGLVSNAFLYNCTKYICRMGKKGNPLTALEDLRKARWYLDRAIEELGDD